MTPNQIISDLKLVMRQGEMSDLIGVSETTISLWRNDHVKITHENYLKIAGLHNRYARKIAAAKRKRQKANGTV